MPGHHCGFGEEAILQHDCLRPDGTFDDVRLQPDVVIDQETLEVLTTLHAVAPCLYKFDLPEMRDKVRYRGANSAAAIGVETTARATAP